MAAVVKLAELRFNAGLTPEELAAEIGEVSGRTIRRLEEGTRPTPKIAKRIADHFETTPSALFPIKDDPPPVLVGRVRKVEG